MPAAVSNASSNESILPYTHGLTGVNLWLNNITTQATWLSFLFLSVIIVAARKWQLRCRYSRMLSTLHLSRQQQRIWKLNQGKFVSRLKKHLLTAPLLKARHNREIQLSRAVGIGTLPSRFHTMLLVIFLVSNIIYCCLLDYYGQSKAALIAEIRGRTGHLAVVNMVALFLFAARNNPLISVLQVSFDTFNLFHRWIGRVVVMEGIVHCAMWAVNEMDALGLHGIIDRLTTDAFAIYGLMSGIAMLIILFQTPSPLRHAFYESFLHFHQFLALVALIGIFLHAKVESLPQIPIIIFIGGIWGSERLLRLFRIIYRNASHRGHTTATIEALDGGACLVKFRIPGSWTHRPGCHIYSYIPGVSLWMSHPFSVAWVDHSSHEINSISRLRCYSKASLRNSSVNIANVAQITEENALDETASRNHSVTVVERDNSLHSPPKGNDCIMFINPDQVTKQKITGSNISSNSSLTAIEHDIDLIAPTKDGYTIIYCVMAARAGMTASIYHRARASANHKISLSAFIEGPYGGMESLRSYATVVLFAGGVGITHQLSQLRDLVSSFAAGLSSTRKVTLIWSVRNIEQLRWTQHWIEEVLCHRAAEQEVKIFAFVSNLKGASGTPERGMAVDAEKTNGFPGEIFDGRVVPNRVLEREFEDRIGAMSVGVCGPGAFADDVRAATRNLMERGNVDFWEEAFTW